MRNKLKPGQIGELVELDRVCDGVGDEVTALIKRLTNGRRLLNTNDVRVIQANVLFDKGLGGDLSFEAYLATIPEIPESLLADDAVFSILRLVDSRLGLFKICELFGIEFKENQNSDESVIALNTRYEMPTEPFWVRAHHNLNQFECKETVPLSDKDKIFYMTAMVSIMVWVQDPSILMENGSVIDCLGSAYSKYRKNHAFLHVWQGLVALDLVGRDYITPPYMFSDPDTFRLE